MRLGQIEIQTVLDITSLHAPIHEVFHEATRAALDPYRSWLEPDALCPHTQRIRIPVQSYLVRTRHHRILIDTCVGCGKNQPDAPDWHERTDAGWLERLAAAGYAPEDIDYVFCTHLHSDHCGWNTRQRDGRWVPTFPNARYVFSRLEYEASAKLGGAPFEQSVLPVAEAGRMQLVEFDFALDDEVWLEPALGHTEGHVVVNLRSGARRAAMCGDMMHSPVQCPHPEWSPVWDRDPEQARRTRRSFLERHCDTDTLVLTAHFPPPSMGRIVPYRGAGRAAATDGFLFRYGE
jgi:glyoxylase-like metal-dependent hydrolase (beta-lactamase superfamily II)